MGKAYSQDLRLRVLTAIDDGMSKMAAHTMVRISRSTIDDWLALRAAQGHVRPKEFVQRGPQPGIADLAAFKVFALRHSGSTLEHMSRAWAQATGRRLGLWRGARSLTFEGYGDAALIATWAEQQLVKERQPGQTVMLDNASFHRIAPLRAILDQAKCFLLPLPPYSPDLNAIEPLWNQIKHTIMLNDNP
jgi:transposase